MFPRTAMKQPSFFRRSELAAVLYGFRRESAVCLLFSMVVNVLMLTPTLYMLQVYDRVMVSRNGLTLVAVTLLMLFFLALMSFADWSRSRLLVRAGVRLDAALGSRIFRAAFEARLGQSGQDPARAFADLANVRQFITGAGVFAFMDAPWTPIYLLVLTMLHPWLGTLGLLFVALLAGLAYAGQRLTSAPGARAGEAGARVDAYLRSKLRNAEVIESLGMLGDLRRRWRQRHRQYLLLAAQAQDLGQRLQALTKFLRYCQQSLVLGAGALLVIRGELSPGAMIAANVLMARALQPVDGMVGTWKAFFDARTAFRRLERLLADHPERATGATHPQPQGHLCLEKVVASAPGRAEPILKGLSADFAAGETVAIIGPSGSGKSTLARVLVGIWPDTGGEVRLDGEPLQSWNREELGPHLGYLPQDVELFEGSIAENIARFGDLDPEEVIRAAKRTGVHDMILRFPRGYDTPMGEAGSLLSGGQRQRIALARALYGDPAVLVLDEPNANLDEAGEAALIAAIQDLKRQGRTVFVITHRMNIVGVADRILVLQDGRVDLLGSRQEVTAALQARSAAPVRDGGRPIPAPQAS